ncbi:hypothetical protein LCGC14_1996580, partial [marine sediment metagenome]
LQYAMRDRLAAFGWSDIETIDDDLGRSASGSVTRAGFERMVAEVCLGKVGAVAAREVSRFARNSRDWQQLIEMCRVVDTVLIDGEKLICTPAGAKGFMVCLAKKTGKLIWANTEIAGSVGYCSPVIAEFGGFRQLLSMTSAALIGVDIKTGKLLWSAAHGNRRSNTATDPIFHKGYVFASSGYGKGSTVVKLKAGEGGIQAEQVWASKLMDNHHGGVVLLDGHLYGSGHQAKGWFCLDLLTGKQAWKADGKGSLTYADGMLYRLEERGTMALVQATPAEQRIVSSFSVPSGGRGLHWAHPVVCDGRLYVRHADKLFAYDIRAK